MAANKGDSVMIPIPMVDRGRGDPRNLIGIVLDRSENDMYKLGVTKGVLKGRFSRNQFDVCQEQFLGEDSVELTNALSIREVVIRYSLGGGQGFIKWTSAVMCCDVFSRKTGCRLVAVMSSAGKLATCSSVRHAIIETCPARDEHAVAV